MSNQVIDKNFPKSQKLPEGYKVQWCESDGMYQWVYGEIEDGPYCDRFDCRRSAIRHFNNKKKN